VQAVACEVWELRCLENLYSGIGHRGKMYSGYTKNVFSGMSHREKVYSGYTKNIYSRIGKRLFLEYKGSENVYSWSTRDRKTSILGVQGIGKRLFLEYKENIYYWCTENFYCGIGV